MHARQLVEVAGLLSLRATPLFRSGATITSDALSEYWIASRCRLDCWGRTLRTLGHSHSTPPADQAGDLLVRLVEEVILSEVLTRVVAAIGCIDDAHRRGEESGPIGLNSLQAHKDTASRLRALIFAWWPADSARARHARTLTRQAGRWTDVLLAYLSVAADIQHLAIDASRLREFAYDSQAHGAESSEGAPQLLLHGLQTAFAEAKQTPLNSDLNRRVAGAALALFGASGSDDYGLARPTWMLRAERTADDTVAMIDRLFSEDEAPAGMRLPARWRI